MAPPVFPLVDFSKIECWDFYLRTLQFLIAVPLASWAVFKWRAHRKMESAKWLQSSYRDFYFNEKFDEVRMKLDYSWDDEVAPAIQLMLDSDPPNLSDTQKRLMVNLDNLLNYLDLLSFLHNRRYLEYSALLDNFNWYLTRFASLPRYDLLRRYLVHFDYCHLNKLLAKIGKPKPVDATVNTDAAIPA